MKVALVYDRVNKIGGAERVLEVLHEIFPEAPLYTSVYDKGKAPWAKKFHIITSFLQYVKFLPHEILPNLMPLAFKSFNFSSYDTVISISSAESKYLNMKEKTKHICYCLTPTRYLWSGYFDYLENPGFGFWNGIVRRFFVVFAPFMRMRDFEEAQKVDKFIAISDEVRRRIKKYYRRESEVVFPPVSFGNKKGVEGKEEIDTGGKYFLIVSRLVPYKRIDLAARVFNDLSDKKLVIVGIGSDEQRLKDMARDNIIFYGQASDTELSTLYNNCVALIFPGVEDFGLTSLEAQSCNKPVICNAQGGTKETLVIGKTGEIFSSKEELKRLIYNFDKNTYLSQDFQNNLLRFSKEKFKRDFEKEIR
jgi:glycosyltransferase involved in cell wall biosynthesis